MKRNFFIFYVLFCSFAAFAQPKNEPEKIPQGKWEFENVTAFEGNVQISFSVSDIDFEIPTGMNVQQDELTFAYKEGTTKTVKYGTVVRGNFFCFLVCAAWKVEGNRLSLQWVQDIDNPESVSGTRTIVLTYKLK